MDFNTLAAECAPWVAPSTLAAIVRTESGFKPLAIGVNGGARLARQPSGIEEAVATAKWLIANGYNIDLGLGQINSANLSKTGLSVEAAFDPCRNLAAAAAILQWNYKSASRQAPSEQSALQAALSAYNTGSFSRGFSNGYVQKVIGNAQGGAVSPIPLVKVARRAAHTVSPSASVRSRPAKASTAVAANMDTISTDPSDKQASSAQDDVMVYR